MGWKRFNVALLLCLLALAGGCAANKAERQARQAVSDYYVGDFAAAQARLKPLAAKTDGDFVLNNVRLGSVSLAGFFLDDAEAAFLSAYEVMNSVGVNNGGRTLGAVLVDEKIKIWRGEPFERAMANFYLGLVYYIRHDYANARAAFENSLFKLRDYGEKSEEDSYRELESNFALGYLMLARCWQHLDREDLARGNLQRLVEIRPDLAALADYDLNQRANVLLVVDYGYGPQKVTEALTSTTAFVPTPAQEGPIPRPLVYVDGRLMPLEGIARPPVDLLALAQDQRWQSIDTIRVAKSVAGDVLIGAGLYKATRQNSDPAATLGLLAAGALLKATSQADVRHWEMLPRTSFVIPMELAPGTYDITVQFPFSRQTCRDIVVPPQGEVTCYMRALRWQAMAGPPWVVHADP